jgi:Fe-S-cluster containining protein
MKYIQKIVREVEKVYADLDREAMYFTGQSELNCLKGCSSCCLYKNIRASVLEMIPLAWYLHLNNQQDEVMEKLDQSRTVCVSHRILDTGEGSGGCLHYEQRPLICRLFGNAGIRIKDGQIAIYTCRIMKDADPPHFQQVMKRLQHELYIPMAQDYQTRLDVIDFALASDIHPINQSLKKAMEKVSFHFRGKPEPGQIRRAV